MKTNQKTSRAALAVPLAMIGLLAAATGTAQQVELAENRLEPSAPRVTKIQKPGPLRGRVWTNEDFPAPPAPASETAAPAAQEPAAAAAPDAPVLPDPMIEQTRQEVNEQMLQVAKDREKAYDGTITLVQAQLQAETNEFRAEVLRQVLEDTLRLKEINKHMLEQFGPKPAAEQASTASLEGRQ